MEQRRLIRFKSGDEQPIYAQEGIEDEECLIFLKDDGSLAAFFDLREVAQWSVDEDSVS